tara:strand:+ start:1772 stop:2326 length:555 start_codon:yes stop_codon:yes gene_type:complete
MRVVGGKSGGVPLMVPKRGTRPTSDKVREALFSMINEFIEGSKCLDLFAGSGALGIEALSRGAGSCIFVDVGKESCSAISSNLKKTRLEQGFVKRHRVKSYVQSCRESFDVIFADPPYEFSESKNNIEKLFYSNAFYDILRIGGIFILETRSSLSTLKSTEELNLKDVRQYGDTKLNLFIRKST